MRKSRQRGQTHIEQAVGKDVPEDSTEHKKGVDTEEDPKQGLLLKPLLIVVQHHHTQCQTHHHPSKVSHKAGIGARRIGRRVEPQPHCPAKLYTHCEQKVREENNTLSVKIWNDTQRNVYMYQDTGSFIVDLD